MREARKQQIKLDSISFWIADGQFPPVKDLLKGQCTQKKQYVLLTGGQLPHANKDIKGSV